MRWITVVSILFALGCDDGGSAQSAAPAEEPASTQPGLPVVIVDRTHMALEGNGKPYLVSAAAGIVLDARKFKFDDPRRLVRRPNMVHLVYDQSLYASPWPTQGKQALTMTAGNLQVLAGQPFKGFEPGTKVDVAIGFEGPDLDHDDVHFTPFWVGSVLFK